MVETAGLIRFMKISTNLKWRLLLLHSDQQMQKATMKVMDVLKSILLKNHYL